MIVNLLILIVGFIILIYGADIFVDGASSLARNFKLSPMLIGLTIVAFGTSAPEFAVSIQSLISNNGDMILGNVIGSNILNTFLILGACALIHSLTVKNNTVKKELPIALLLTSLFIVLMADSMFSLGENSFTRQDGIVLLLFFLVFIYYLISMMRNKVDADQDTPIKYNKFKSSLLTILGIVGIIMGSRFVVDGASTIAEILGVSQRMISLTIVALGTSLPELATSIAATRKGEYDIAIGNVIGSNIFNIGIVVGLPVAILGGINNIAFNYVDLGVLFVASLVLFIFSFNDRKITKAEGIMMLMLFLTYYSYVIFF
jgi:cation:H+ antiporter